jgi:hypothetical protein
MTKLGGDIKWKVLQYLFFSGISYVYSKTMPLYSSTSLLAVVNRVQYCERFVASNISESEQWTPAYSE